MMGKRITPTVKYIVTAAVILLIVALYFIYDPGKSALAPKCIFHEMTGLDCPGCGSQRMLHALLHGDLQGAWQANAFLLCMLPVIATVAAATFCRRRMPRFYNAVNSLPVIITIGTAIVVWTIARNF